MPSRSLVYAGWFLLVTSAAFGQWVLRQTGTTENLNGIAARGPQGATVVGANATILYSEDDGWDWGPQEGEPGIDYNAVSFADHDTGLVAGTSGTILFTVDAGNEWQTIETGWMHPYYAAHQSTGQIGAVAGVNSVFQPLIGRSTNGWLTHDFLVFYPFFNGSNHEGTITDIHFFTADSCAATVSLTEGGGAICWTAQVGFGGWETQLVHDQPFYGLDFWDDQHAVAVGAGGLLTVTANGGWTWQEQTLLTDANLRDVCYGATAQEVWAVGEGGTILYSSNGGADWSSQDSPVGVNLNSVSMLNSDTGYVAGDNGVVLYTANGGGGTPENNPPGEFVRVEPQDSLLYDTQEYYPVVLYWTTSEDPDGQDITYLVHVWTDYNYWLPPDAILEVTTLDTSLDLEIPVPLSPLDDVFSFWWTVHATDGEDTVEAVNGEGFFMLDIIMAAGDPFIPHPSSFSLAAYPNPFNPTTTLSVSLPVSSEAGLRIFDVTGRLVHEARLGRLESGMHELAFDGSALPSGLYLATLEAGRARMVQKLVLMK